MKYMDKQLLIFDFDGLIIDTESADYESWREVFEAHACELRMLPRDGTLLWVRLESICTPDATAAPVCRTVLCNITARRLSEAARQNLTTRLKLATEAGGVGIWDYELADGSLIWDDQMLRLYGITRAQFSGTYAAWKAGVHPEDRQRLAEELQQALRGEQEFDTDFRVRWPDGNIRHLKAQAHVQRDGSGQPVRMLGTNWDIEIWNIWI